MRAFRILQAGREIGFASDSSTAIDCLKISWSTFTAATWTIGNMEATLHRPGFEPIRFTFEPIDVWSRPTHL